MARNRRRRLEGGNEAVGWIAYTDFVTALALVFVALFIVNIVLSASDQTVLSGKVVEQETDTTTRGVSDCEVFVNPGTSEPGFARTDSAGAFVYTLRGLSDRIPSDTTVTIIDIEANCLGYEPGTARVPLDGEVDDTTNVPDIILGDRQGRCATPIGLLECQLADKTEQINRLQGQLESEKGRRAAAIEDIPGTTLFQIDQDELSPEGGNAIREIMDRNDVRGILATNDKVLAILGHTDDLPDPRKGGNWELSARRAAAAALFIMREDRRFCGKLVVMGFGASRPSERVYEGDPSPIKQTKRSGNRRLEFRILTGAEVTGGMPVLECPE